MMAGTAMLAITAVPAPGDPPSQTAGAARTKAPTTSPIEAAATAKAVPAECVAQAFGENVFFDHLGMRTGDFNQGESRTVVIGAPPGMHVFHGQVPGPREAGRAGIVRANGSSSPTPTTAVAATPAP